MKNDIQKALAYKPLQYLLVVGGVLFIAYLIGRSAGKRVALGTQVPYPKGNDTLSEYWVDSVAPKILEATREILNGVDTSADKGAVAQTLLSLNDTQLTYIYNRYNQLYHSGSKNTLLTDINDDWFGFDWFEPARLKKDLVTRMMTLGMV